MKRDAEVAHPLHLQRHDGGSIDMHLFSKKSLFSAGLMSAIGLCTFELTTSSAVACVGQRCRQGAALPESGALPANAVTMLWRKPLDFDQRSDTPGAVAHLYRLDGDQRSELEISETPTDSLLVRISPKQPVEEGSTLVLEWEEKCEMKSALASTTFRVGPPAPLPTSAGHLRAEMDQGLVDVPVSTGECDVVVETAMALLKLELSNEAKPYSDALMYELVVDGKPGLPSLYYDGPSTKEPQLGSSIPRGEHLIYTVCEAQDGVRPDAGLSPGRHRVSMIASLPDGTKLSSDEVEVDLQCHQRSSGCSAVAGKGEHALLEGLAFLLGALGLRWRAMRQKR